MSFSPLLTASLPVILHAFAALFLCGLTLVLFTFKRGARAHRVLGWIWVCLMGFVALTSFWISDLRHFGPFSVIHALSL